VFKRLNEELSRVGQSLELICAGGYVMQRHGYRATIDIDAFYKSNEEIESIIRKVGDEFNINKPDELWLNNSLSNLNPMPHDEYCETIYRFSNLLIKTVNILYLIGMKLTSAREQDMIDVGNILKHENDQLPFGLLSKLSDMKFDIDISILLDAYEKAHGMDWLENFYVKNQNELKKYF
jgi:hypothetical protein